MDNFTLTELFIIIVVVSSLAYDLYQFKKNDGVTISMWVRRVSQTYPIVPFLLGMLAGHFFWYN